LKARVQKRTGINYQQKSRERETETEHENGWVTASTRERDLPDTANPIGADQRLNGLKQ
jgi:hypothetical protein